MLFQLHSFLAILALFGGTAHAAPTTLNPARLAIRALTGQATTRSQVKLPPMEAI